jgi:RNA polymerase sigma factor (sigma-70 family)
VIRDTASLSQAADTAREINAEGCRGVTFLCHIDEPSRHRKYPAPRTHSPPTNAPRTHELDELLTAVGANRDGAAFTALFDHFRPRVHAQMLRLGLAPFAAADVTQDVMETIWCKAHLFDRRKSAAATWVFRIAQNRRIDVRRRSREHIYADADLSAIADPVTDNDASIDAAQCEQHVHAALGALPRDQFKIVQLAFSEGLSHSTIAARTKIPVGTVKSRLRVAFSCLRRVLADAGVKAA